MSTNNKKDNKVVNKVVKKVVSPTSPTSTKKKLTTTATIKDTTNKSTTTTTNKVIETKLDNKKKQKATTTTTTTTTNTTKPNEENLDIDLDSLFDLKKQKRKEIKETKAKQEILEKKKVKKPIIIEKDDFFDSRGANIKERKMVDGLPVYTEEELGLDKEYQDNDTADCPFDCNCCF